MPTTLSVDLRQRVASVVSAGAAGRQATGCFGWSRASSSRWSQQKRRLGRVAPKPLGGDQRSRHIEAHAELIQHSPPLWRWQQRYGEEGVEGLLRDKARAPGKPPHSTDTVAEMLALTYSIGLAVRTGGKRSPCWRAAAGRRCRSRPSSGSSPRCCGSGVPR
ncbi:hypothetical protein GCM10007890_01290 [Methylobacterium tardum]|uniref:Transposase n=1 Tax=Methylobacterium tardum TaxID=374432 RepID=A0AA37TG54_9HYPH|nr:hypothetical protein GCM10007890_01290 [Methylobacterium tardum]